MNVTEPGLVFDLDEAAYHADPVPAGSLSASGAHRIALAPARFLWEQTNPPAPRAEFDFGHAAHRLVLGVGPVVVELPAEDWRSSKVRAIANEQRALGRVPLLAKDAGKVKGMAAALAQHPRAAQLLAGDGAAEVSAFRVDPVTGGWLRARFDWLAPAGIVDYKTAETADPDKWVRRAIDYGYHQQAAWYFDMADALGCDVSEGFRFVVQEKSAPFLVSVVRFDEETMTLGRDWNRWAIDTWTECRTSGDWPGYPADDVTVTAPPWAPRPPGGPYVPPPIPAALEAELDALAILH